jgi:hypothetical protein
MLHPSLIMFCFRAVSDVQRSSSKVNFTEQSKFKVFFYIKLTIFPTRKKKKKERAECLSQRKLIFFEFDIEYSVGSSGHCFACGWRTTTFSSLSTTKKLFCILRLKNSFRIQNTPLKSCFHSN